MASRSSSYRPSRRLSPEPSVASGSRSRNQEEMEGRHQSARGRSRSRSPRHERWNSNPPDGWHAPPMSSGRSRMGSQRSSTHRREDRYDRREGGRDRRDRDSRSSAGRRRRNETESADNWRTRARSSPPAETTRTRRRSRSLSPQGYHPRHGRRAWQERDEQGGSRGYTHSGRRSQSSDASMRSVTSPSPRRHDEQWGREEQGSRQARHTARSRDRHTGQGKDAAHRHLVQDQPMGATRNDPDVQGDAGQVSAIHNYGATYTIGNAGNVFTGINHGNVYMESVRPAADDFMVNLSNRLKICVRADHRYYAPDDEAALRRGQCTPGTQINTLQGVTQWAINMSPSSERVYWLSGQAGSGKTTIAYTIACQLESQISNDHSRVTLGASFFCSRQFVDTRSASSIVRTIVHQLALKSRSFQAALKQHGKFETVEHGPRSQFMGLLAEPWEKSASERQAEEEPCYVVSIDALDELEGTGGTEFLGTLIDVLEQQDLSGIKFFVTSRSHPVLVKRMESFSNKKVCRLEEVPIEETSADIQLFLNLNLAECATTQQIQQLVLDAGGLFIYAATVVEFVKDRSIEEQKSVLKGILSTSSPAVRRRSRGVTATLDDLYMQVLDTCLVDPRDRNDPDAFQDCLSILHTFLCTIERTSPSVAVDILNASGHDGDIVLDTGVAEGVLHRLHAVLYSQGGQVMFFHKSFSDFLFDKGRSLRFFCDQEHHHHRLSSGCLGVMRQQLRFNIADIPSSYKLYCNDPTLSARIENNISRSLRYACSSWSAHLSLTSPEARDRLTEILNDFLQLRILFWVESMNLLGQRSRCQGMLRDAQRWFTKSKDQVELARRLADLAVFAAYHCASIAALSTPHLYISSLATFPRRSAIVQAWRRQFGGIPGFVNVEGAGGDALVASISVEAEVIVLSLSPDGMNVAVRSARGLVQIWDLSTGEKVMAVTGQVGVSNAVTYSPDGTQVASASHKGLIQVWDTSTGEEVKAFQGHTGDVLTVAYAPDGTHIVSGSTDRSLRLWNLSTGEEARVFTGHNGAVQAVAYSADGAHVASASHDRSVRVWDLSTGVQVRLLTGHTHYVWAVAYSPDSTHIISGSLDTTVRVWDLSTGEEAAVLRGHTDSIWAVAHSPDRTHVVSGSEDKSIRLWDWSTGDALRVIMCHTHISQVAYSPDGTHVVSGSFDKLVRVWDLSMTEEARVCKGHMGTVNGVAYSPDGTHIISGSDDKTMRLWDSSTGEERRVLTGPTGKVLAVAYSPDGTHVASGSDDNSVQVWCLSTGKEVGVLTGHTDVVRAVAYSPDGSHIVSASKDKSLRVWDLLAGEVVRVLKGHTEAVLTVACSPDGKYVISGSRDRSIRLWDLSTGKEAKLLACPSSHAPKLACSPDGTHVASASSDKAVRIWNLSTGEVEQVLELRDGSIPAVAYSPGGTHIIFSSVQTIGVWGPSTGQEVMLLAGHTGWVDTVTSSPDGIHVVSGSTDSSVRVWDISSRRRLRYVRQRVDLGPFHGIYHPGWLLSPTDPSAHLMFVPPAAQLPDDRNILTFPASAVPHLDLAQAKLGDRWVECYTPISF